MSVTHSRLLGTLVFAACGICGLTMAAGDSKELPPRSVNDAHGYTGTVKGLAIVADFPDQPISRKEIEDLSRAFNSRELGEDGRIQSLTKYYEILSRGALSFHIDVAGPIRLPESSRRYYDMGFNRGAKGQQVSLGRFHALEYCLKSLTSQGFDFSPYTRSLKRDERQELAFLCFVMNAEGPPKTPGGVGRSLFSRSVTNLRWAGVTPVTANGVRFNTFFGGEELYTFVHETAHRILGWPDLYGVRSNIGPATGVECIMSGPLNKYPDPYHMYQSGWLKAENIYGKSGTFSVKSGDVHFAYTYFDPKNPEEYFFIQPMLCSGPIKNELPDEGLAIWRIYTKGTNSMYPKKSLQVELVHADGINASFAPGGIFFKAGLHDAYGADTLPSSRWKYGPRAGMDSGLDISDVSAVGATMRFTVNRKRLKTNRVIHSQYTPPDEQGWIPTASCDLPVRSIQGFKEINREAVYRITTPNDLRWTMKSNFFLAGYETPIDYCVWGLPQNKGGKPEVVIRFDAVRTIKYIEVCNYSDLSWAEDNMSDLTAWVSNDEAKWRFGANARKTDENRWLLTLPDSVSARFLRLGTRTGKGMVLSQVYIYGR